MDLNRIASPLTFVAAAALVVAGVALESTSAALIVAGVALFAAWFFLIDDGRPA